MIGEIIGRIQYGQLWRKTRGKLKEYKWNFFFCMVFSITVYSLLMSNQLVNDYDGLWFLNMSRAGKWELSIGRWLWLYIDRLRFCISTDPWTSLMTLTLFSMGILLVLDMYKIRGKCARCLVSALFLSSTVVCVSLSYRYMSPTFGLAFLLSVAAVYMAVYIHSIGAAILAGAAAVAFSMGLYQPYIGCTCLILLGDLAIMCGEEGVSWKRMAEKMIRGGVSILLGGVAYIIILKLHLLVFGVEMSSYRGGDSYSVLNSIYKLPQSIPTSFARFADYFWGDSFRSNALQPFYVYHFIFAMVLVWMVGMMVQIRISKGWQYAICFAICMLLVPVACNAVSLIATDTGASLQMTGGVALCLPVLICIGVRNLHGLPGRYFRALGIVSGFAFILLVWGNIYQVQYDLNAMDEGRNASMTITERIIDYLDEEDCLGTDTPVCLAGRPAGSPLFNVSDKFWKANDIARFGEWFVKADCIIASWRGMLCGYKGVNVTFCTDEDYNRITAGEKLRSMPCFPQEGCSYKDGEILVIKISENYRQGY